MVQTNFSVGNVGSLTTVLADISGGPDAAINTAYTIAMTAGVSLTAGVTLETGSSVTLEGTFPFIAPAFAVTGTIVTDLNFTGTVSLNHSVLNNPALIISNGTTIAGLFTGSVLSKAGDSGDIAVNNGVIVSGGAGVAVGFNSGTVQNGWNGSASALISGVSDGVIIAASGLVQNGGTIIGSFPTSAAVSLGSGTVDNGQIGVTGAELSGGQNGVVILGAGAVINDGMIFGGTYDAVSLGSGLVTNGQIGVGSALIDGGAGGNGVSINTGVGTVNNFATIIGGGASGVYLADGGTVTNGAPADPSALINGAAEGVLLLGPGSLLNYGTVLADGSDASQSVIGAFFFAGGTIENLTTSALIGGLEWGAVVENGAGLVTNLGTIQAAAVSGLGVDLTAGGTVVNAGTILGGSNTTADGVRISGGAAGAGAVVLNNGTIEGTVGVDFQSGPTEAAGTLTNNGLIVSTSGASGDAVVFGTGAERLVLQAAGAFVGSVAGGSGAGSSTTLELTGGTQGTLSGLSNGGGTVTDSAGSFTFSAMSTIAVDTGASWTIVAPGNLSALNNAGAVGISGGSVTVTGSLINSGSLSVGSSALTVTTGVLADQGIITVGAGGLLKANGGGLSAAGTPDIQVGGGASSTLNVTGSGATVNTSGHELGIGSSGQGSALISQGGTILAGTPFASDDAVYTGGSAGATGGLTITDPGSLLRATGQFSVGLGGNGSLLIENQATVVTGNNAVDKSEGFDVGQLATASGAVTVTGTHSVLSNTGRFVVGDAGLGSLSIQSGGTVITTPGTVAGLAGAVIANTASASGSSVTVTGTGSTWQVTGALTVGNAGFGDLAVSQGATVTAGSLDMGAAATGDGVASIVGTATALTLTGDLTVGDQSTGELTILAGARVSGASANIGGSGAGSPSSVDIEGPGSALTLTGSLAIGLNGPAVFTLGQNTVLTLGGNLITGIDGTFNQSGTVDPPNIINDNVTNLSAGAVDLADISVENSGQYTVQNGTATFYTPLITFDPVDTPGGGFATGSWDIKSGGTLMLNATTVDASQVIQFGATNAVLVIGQQPDVDPGGKVTGTIAPNAPSVLANFQAPIENFKAGDTIRLAALTFASDTVSGNTVTLWNGPAGTGTDLGSLSFLKISGAPDTVGAALAATQIAGTALCFLAGTLIGTPEGQTEVERLVPGDLVLTASGAVRPVAWIGHGRVLATRGRRNAATPVIVRKGALGPNVPHTDLHVTKGHALWFDGVLIPVEFLVNHRSILWDDRAQEVSVYHVELETHDVLIANGAAAESYRDDGNRWLFQNANSGWDQPAKAPCAPVLTGGPVVDAVWRRLLDLCGPRPGVPLTGDPDLCLMVDGVRVEASERTGDVPGDVYVFGVDAGDSVVKLVSRAAAPQEIGVASDPRCLGVAVRRVAVRQGTRFRVVRADDPVLSQGFHAFEPGTGLRWTDGDAALPAALFDGFAGKVEVVVHLGGTATYVDEGGWEKVA